MQYRQEKNAKAGHVIGDRFGVNDPQHRWAIQTLLLKLGFNTEKKGKRRVDSDGDALSRHRPHAPGARESAKEGTISERKEASCANRQGFLLPSVADGYDKGDRGERNRQVAGAWSQSRYGVHGARGRVPRGSSGPATEAPVTKAPATRRFLFRGQRGAQDARAPYRDVGGWLGPMLGNLWEGMKP